MSIFINIYIVYHERHASSPAATVIQYNTQGQSAVLQLQSMSNNMPYPLHCSPVPEPGKKLRFHTVPHFPWETSGLDVVS